MRAILSISLLPVFCAPSFAADIIFDPDPVPPMAISLPDAPFTWSGRYIGIDLGYGRSAMKEDMTTEGLPSDLFNIKQGEGAFGGIYAGFGKQARKIYFGLEGDIQYAALKGKSTGEGEVTAEFSPTWLGSTRLRVGYAMDNIVGLNIGGFLPYVTGGLAFGGFKAKVMEGENEWIGTRSGLGYSVGGGIDYAINNNTIAKLEYQYLGFGNRSYADETDYARVKFKAHTLRAGVAYKF